MNDKFKFRAWDGKQMHYFTFNDINNKGSIRFKGLPVETEDSVYVLFKELKLDSDACIVTQSTGYLDKNGKLIYDGDVITVNGSHNILVENLQLLLSYFEEHHLYYKASDCEIIGNIFEHPTLLTSNERGEQ